jgi:hypothetical protein
MIDIIEYNLTLFKLLNHKYYFILALLPCVTHFTTSVYINVVSFIIYRLVYAIILELIFKCLSII